MPCGCCYPYLLPVACCWLPGIISGGTVTPVSALDVVHLPLDAPLPVLPSDTLPSDHLHLVASFVFTDV